LTILPGLENTDVWARGRELTALKHEVERLVAALAPDDEEYWGFRLGNILQAIQAASTYGENGLVVIS
jgi:hypothetical protein